MIEFIHRHPVVIKVLLSIVTLAFVGTGGWFMSKEDTGDYAAKVDKATISTQEYEDARYRMEEFYRNLYQGKMPPEVMQKMDIGKKAIDALVDRKIFLLAAEKEGIQVTDDEISDAVTSNKSFQGEGGRFSKARYEDVLKMNGMTTASYEKALRQDLTIEKYKKMIKDSVYVTDQDVRNFYKKQLEAQKKEFKEDEYAAQKENLARILTLTEQEKAVNSFLDGLKKSYAVTINPRIIAAG